MTIFRRGNSLLGPANALGTRCSARLMLWEFGTRPGYCSGNAVLGLDNATGTWCLARLAPRSPTVGSVDAPEPGFRPGALGALARAGGSARQNMAASEPARFSPRRELGILARWGSGTLGALAHAAGSGARRGVGFPWRLTLSRLCLGWCCGLRVVAGLPVCGAVRGGERHVLLRSYVVGVHWVRAYACVALGEWRTDAASEEVYVGAGGGIASVAR